MVKRIVAMLDEMFESVFGMLLLVLLVWVLTWLYLEATPDQLSGEADIHRAEIERLGLDYRPCY